MEEQYKTSYTLLQRAVDLNDDEAWKQLVAHYRRFIHYVLHGLNVPPSDLDDLAQEVLVVLLDNLSRYDRSVGRFRTWFSTIIRNTAVKDYRRRVNEKRRIEKWRTLEDIALLGRANEVDTYIEEEWATYIASQAMERVKKLFQGQAIEVFELALDGLSAPEIADRTGLTVSSVYTLKKRVKKRLYLEVLDLTQDLETC
ncbi:RNA polymerase sigma factor [Pontiella agarivorans]|uniref:RNA polymerase sigma factor SigS n=1 Tax=Pontiella agarivorans TaxID=3038953 RepID=A0ABU5N0Q0_9BACT|nr:sigma-70 family RNA polymerase sigma factor [Pontiella agarivorans]MDZ8120025.1 sigma-70 family RNA polymerase sigma factor [Pontiella agarivorans]